MPTFLNQLENMPFVQWIPWVLNLVAIGKAFLAVLDWWQIKWKLLCPDCEKGMWWYTVGLKFNGFVYYTKQCRQTRGGKPPCLKHVIQIFSIPKIQLLLVSIWILSDWVILIYSYMQMDLFFSNVYLVLNRQLIL